jgi:sulfur transfer complex TusBCD TusB component (DsrH family)
MHFVREKRDKPPGRRFHAGKRLSEKRDKTYTPQAGITVAERLITICPKLLSLLVAAKEDFGARGGPGDGAPQCLGDGG